MAPQENYMSFIKEKEAIAKQSHYPAQPVILKTHIALMWWVCRSLIMIILLLRCLSRNGMCSPYHSCFSIWLKSGHLWCGPLFRKKDSSLEMSALAIGIDQPLFIIPHFVLQDPFQNKLWDNIFVHLVCFGPSTNINVILFFPFNSLDNRS